MKRIITALALSIMISPVMAGDTSLSEQAVLNRMWDARLGPIVGVTLPLGQIWMGDTLSNAAEVSVTGDILISSSGVTSYNGNTFSSSQTINGSGGLKVKYGIDAGSITVSDKISGNYADTSGFASDTQIYSLISEMDAPLTSGVEISNLLGRIRWKHGGNSNAILNGVEGVCSSTVTDESITCRGGSFRTYTGTGGTIRTSVGADISARAGSPGASDIVAESGTGFIGARIYMAPGFTPGSISNVNNFHGLWIYNEHATNAVTNGIYLSHAGGGFTHDIVLQNGESINNNVAGTMVLTATNLNTSAEVHIGAVGHVSTFPASGSPTFDGTATASAFVGDGLGLTNVIHSTSVLQSQIDNIAISTGANASNISALQIQANAIAVSTGTNTIAIADIIISTGQIQTDLATEVSDRGIADSAIALSTGINTEAIAALRISTGATQDSLASVILSTGVINDSLSSVILSTGIIQASLDSVIISTGIIKNSLDAVILSTGGAVVATSFSGDGSGLTSIASANISGGNLGANVKAIYLVPTIINASDITTTVPSSIGQLFTVPDATLKYSLCIGTSTEAGGLELMFSATNTHCQ